jgi:hypothetical protein
MLLTKIVEKAAEDTKRNMVLGEPQVDSYVQSLLVSFVHDSQDVKDLFDAYYEEVRKTRKWFGITSQYENPVDLGKSEAKRVKVDETEND